MTWWESMTRPKSRIVLVSMPFAAPAIPSIAITQLKSVAETRFPREVSVETLYLNHDFATWLGDLEAYRLAFSNLGFMTGLGDWMFRQEAFPDAPDNTAAYVARYYAGAEPGAGRAVEALLAKRTQLGEWMDTVIAEYRLTEADIVGFTALFAQTVASFALARRLKAVKPGLTIVMGGAACSGEMGVEYARQVKSVDYFFSGPSLVSFPEFIRCRRDGDQAGMMRLKGVLSAPSPLGRQGLDIRFTTPSPLVGEGWGERSDGHPPERPDDLDLNVNVKLDYDAFLDSLARHFPGGGVEPILLFETSRGCWWGEHQRCTFCGLNGPSLCFRDMKPAAAVEQIQSLYRYASRCRFMESVDTVLPRDYLEQVMPSLHPPAGLKIQYEVRATLREPELRTLSEAGVTVLQPGIESLSSDTLKLMHKGTTAFQNIRFLKACAKLPVTVGWNLLIFSPGEPESTYERYLQLIPLLTHLHPPQSASLIGFVRFSEYFDHPDRYGLDLRPEDHYGLTFPFDAAALSRVAVKFYDAGADTARMGSWLARLNVAVNGWRARWMNSDHRGESRLCIAEDGARKLIYDSRSGTPIHHVLTSELLDLLTYLEAPRSAAETSRDRPASDGETHLPWLRERGLLFEEGDRAMGLVIL